MFIIVRLPMLSAGRSEFLYLIISNIFLWLLVLGLLAIVVALTRQVGVLHERIAPAGIRSHEQGASVGDPLPEQELTSLDGRAVRLGGVNADGKSTLLFFLGPDCPVCKSLLPSLKSGQSKANDWLDIVLVGDRDLPAQRRYSDANELAGFIYVASSAPGIALGVGQLPFIVLADEIGMIRAKGLVDSGEQLDRIFVGNARGVASIQDYLDSPSGEAA